MDSLPSYEEAFAGYMTAFKQSLLLHRAPQLAQIEALKLDKRIARAAYDDAVREVSQSVSLLYDSAKERAISYAILASGKESDSAET